MNQQSQGGKMYVAPAITVIQLSPSAIMIGSTGATGEDAGWGLPVLEDVNLEEWGDLDNIDIE